MTSPTTTPTTTASLDFYAADVEGKISDGGQSAAAADVAWGLALQ